MQGSKLLNEFQNSILWKKNSNRKISFKYKSNWRMFFKTSLNCTEISCWRSIGICLIRETLRFGRYSDLKYIGCNVWPLFISFSKERTTLWIYKWKIRSVVDTKWNIYFVTEVKILKIFCNITSFSMHGVSGNIHTFYLEAILQTMIIIN